MASHLTSKEEKKDLEKIFRSMDKDGNGTLDRQEVLYGYEEHFGVAITEEAVDAMFQSVDLDGNNCIDYTEFVMATMNEKDLISNEKLKAAFRLFDKDNSGTISPDEIRKVLGIGSSDLHLSQLIAEIDENGDGEIQFDEFCNMMRRLTV
jgi:calcium-dependent protein kinase